MRTSYRYSTPQWKMKLNFLENTLPPNFPPISSSVTGSFGELLQGELPGEKEFLVTCPINISSTSYFYQNNNIRSVEVYPPCKTKTKQAIKLYLDYLKKSVYGLLIIDSHIENGKGLASSTADIVSALRTISKVLRQPITAVEIENILRHIEPSDGVMYDTPVVFQHRKVKLLKQLQPLPDCVIFAVDEGGKLDTISYNRHYLNYSFEEQKQFADLLNKLENAIHNRNLSDIGQVATASTKIHQQRLPKQHFEWFSALQCEIGALGIINSHSGTMMGMLLDINCDTFPEQIIYLSKKTTANGLFHRIFSLAN
ncbi:GHMP family kinase ATP-binding protein [Xenorhabdus bovienii]|uniref:GHMP family kinase ATP-binding protein n=1 Tax=Xenorhabdus bovienii TaxID=40576 RepID=UPI0023B27242|nr:hypothetical protein [Xenorhabdus bovienii]MDE9467194.1 hypothetical protein [Xenorhabdus bovienii]